MYPFKAKIGNDFNAAAHVPGNNFFYKLQYMFDDMTARQVKHAFKKLLLPLPEDVSEFRAGGAGMGIIIPLNGTGMVLRIEYADSASKMNGGDRIDDSPYITRPILSVDAGLAVIELCPAVRLEKDDDAIEDLKRDLISFSIEFWDDKISNRGRVPVSTPEFPDGIPVVIDRLAVRKFKNSIAPVRMALEESRAAAALAAQDALYAPLAEAVAAGWDDPKKMKAFWRLCRRFLAEGKLVEGWREKWAAGIHRDVSRTHDCAEAYALRLRAAKVTR